ncbi:MAG: YraN family protein [Armatimonadota bacterium]
MPHSRRIGADAESLAAQHLRDKGYVIVKRNYAADAAEIDIIALDGETLVFVEVKYRKESGWETPEESVSPAKQKRLWKAAEQYLAEAVGKEQDMRFDVIAIRGSEVTHYVDAFRPSP